MFPSSWLDVVVGLVFLYALVSLTASSLLELVASALSWRARDLEAAARVLLGQKKTWGFGDRLTWFFAGGGFAEKTEGTPSAVLGHPLIESAAPTSRDAPSYIPAKSFALALFDTLVPKESVTLENLKAALQSEKHGEKLRRALLPLVNAASTLEDAQKNVSEWFDSGMERLSGLYKRRSQVWLIVFGLAVAAPLNLDTFRVAETLAKDAVVAAAIAEVAEADYSAWRAEQGSQGDSEAGTAEPKLEETTKKWEALAEDVRHISESGFTVGWKKDEDVTGKGLLGILITGLMTALGASTWFEILGRTLALRSALRPKKAEGE